MNKIFKNNLLQTIFKATGLIVLFFCVFNLNINIQSKDITQSYINIPYAYASEDQSTIEKSIKGVLYLLASTVAWFLTFGLDASATIVDPTLFEGIFVNMDDSLYDIWSFVRDIFNVFFIFILLFSAFATVFQVQKYHLFKSNVLVMIIIMALLVNFSWPITRVIIDAGNITMYYLLDNFIDSDGPKSRDLFGLLGSDSKIMKELVPDSDSEAYKNRGISDAFFALVMMIAFAFAFILYAILFFIRISAFVILLVISPIGFVAAIFPGTKKFADMWWSSLLKWTFVGPLLLFIIFIAIKFITTMDTILTEIHSTGVSEFQMVHRSILYGTALVIIFTGISVSQKIGGGLAQSAIEKTKNMGKLIGRGFVAGVAGEFVVTGRFLDSKLGSPVAKIDGAIRGYKKRFFDNESKSEEKWRLANEEAAARARENLGQKGDVEKYKKNTIAEYRKRTRNQSNEDLKKILNEPEKHNKYYKQAVVEEIASRKDSIEKTQDLVESMKLMGNNFEESLDLIKKAASSDAIDGSNGRDYKKLIEIIDSKTNLDSKQRDMLKTAVKERYISEGNVKAIYEGNKIFSKSEQIASNQALLNAVIPANFNFTSPYNRSVSLNLKTEVLRDVDFNTDVETFTRSLERAINTKNIDSADKTRFINNINTEHMNRIVAKDEQAINNIFTENTLIKDLASQEEFIKEMPNNRKIRDVYKKLAINPKIKTELLKEASIETRQILRNEGIV